MRTALLLGLMLLVAAPAWGDECECCSDKKKIHVGGRAGFLEKMPKPMVKLVDFDAKKRIVGIVEPNAPGPRPLPVAPAADVRIDGWFGRLSQLKKGTQAWVWLEVDSKRRTTRVRMIADALSEKHLHDTVKDKATLTKRRTAQIERMRALWRKSGLPGTVTFLHAMSGEMELTLDHEAMRWGRHLARGAEVSFRTDPVIVAQVKRVEPWRERTRLRLVVAGVEQGRLRLGQRVDLKVPEPPKAVQGSELPTDIGRAKGKSARLDWLFASIYCTCNAGGDKCAGKFYTLASCHASCPMPPRTRKAVTAMLDKGLTDLQIVSALLEERGSRLLRPHIDR